MNQVGKISYLNAAPTFFDWPEKKLPLVSAPPRQLAQLARLNQIIAGPLPLVEGWSMAQSYEPLESWGIAVRGASQSVLLLSKKPISELSDLSVGVTVESSTSVALLEVLIKVRYAHTVSIQRGFRPDDQARLIIGNEALMYSLSGPHVEWPHVTDLATEWWEWKKLPFVFAQWVVRKDIAPEIYSQLVFHVEHSLAKGLKNLPEIAKQEANHLDISSEKLLSYLRGFIYEMGEDEGKSMAHFHNLFRDIRRREAVLI